MKLKTFFIATPIIGISVFIGLWVYYYYSIKQANENAFKLRFENEFKPSQFNGVVKGMDTIGCVNTYRISSKGREEIIYTLCDCENEEFKKFVRVGDSVVKYKGNTKVLFIKPNKDSKELALPFCK